MDTSKSHGKDYELFGKKITFLREKNSYTQSQVAKLLDIAQSTYAGYEMGVRKVPLSLIKKISSLYNVNTDFLLSDEEDFSMNEIISDNEILTLAAHRSGYEGELSEEELDDIKLAIKVALARHNKV